MKTIPAFKPLPAAGSTAGSTPEKMSPSHPSGSGWVNEQHSNVASVASGNAAKEKQRKKAGRKPAVTAHLSSPKVSRLTIICICNFLRFSISNFHDGSC